MASLQNAPAVHKILFLPSSQHGRFSPCFRRDAPFLVKACKQEQSVVPPQQVGRRPILAVGVLAPYISLFCTTTAFAAEAQKGFIPVSDNKDGYSFLYPFGWQEVTIKGQDKVFKDVIEPLESVSVNMVPTSKLDIRDLGSPQEVAEALIRKVLAPSTQKTKLVEATEHDVDGRAYYTFEFIAQAPNYVRHALGAISIGNGASMIQTAGRFKEENPRVNLKEGDLPGENNHVAAI